MTGKFMKADVEPRNWPPCRWPKEQNLAALKTLMSESLAEQKIFEIRNLNEIPPPTLQLQHFTQPSFSLLQKRRRCST
jgi:hypothetical protein